MNKPFQFKYILAIALAGLCLAAVNKAVVMFDSPRIVGIDGETLGGLNSEELQVLQDLGRYTGQTRFLNPAHHYDGPSFGRAAANESGEFEEQSGGERSIVESDIVQEDPERKLLFTLNTHRGLQVIDMSTPTASKIVGRVKPTGNNPQDMYVLNDLKKVLVLERIYYDDSGIYSYDSKQSRLIVIDVTDPSAPKPEKVLELDGEIASSRLSIEGQNKVLYVITSQRPNWHDRHNDQEFKGFVHSVNLAGLFIDNPPANNNRDTRLATAPTQTVELELPAQKEDINVVEADGKYFVLVATNKQRWVSWGVDNGNQVEVVDITDPTGKMKKLMVANIEGWVDERSQMFVKDKHLVVVSNYIENQNNWFQKISVQSYKLPDPAAGPLENLPAIVERPTSVTRPPIQARGADDETGADIQDVRVDGDLLYVFWVPRLQLDPLEVFDLSRIQENGLIEHKVHFEDIPGFVQKAFPMTVTADMVPNLPAEKYILALGFIESPERRPAIYLIALKDSDWEEGDLSAHRVADLPLVDNDRTWENFNRQDKLFSMRRLSSTSGQLLFTMNKVVNRRYTKGAQLVNFDFQRISDRNSDDFFSNGGFLKGDSYYLKRAFYSENSGDRVVTFSDTNLAIFPQTDSIAANSTVEPDAKIELARDVRATLPLKGQTLQIVAAGKNNYWWKSTEADERSVELRLTQVGAGADAEKHEIAQTITLPGNYESHILDDDNDQLLLMTSSWTSEAGAEGERRQVRHFKNIYRVKADGSFTSDQFEATQVYYWHPFLRHGYSLSVPYYSVLPSQFIIDEQGNALVVSGVDLYKVDLTSRDVAVNKLNLSASCEPIFQEPEQPEELEDRFWGRQPAVTLVPVDKEGSKVMYAQTSQVGKLEDMDLSYKQTFVSQLKVSADSVECGPSINVPGQPVAIENGYLVTLDTLTQSFKQARVVEYVRPTPQPLPVGNEEVEPIDEPTDPAEAVEKDVYRHVQVNAASVVKLSEEGAKLTDLAGTSGGYTAYGAKKVADNHYVIFANQQNVNYSWQNTDRASDHSLISVRLSNTGKFDITPTVVRLPTSRHVGISKVFQSEGDKKLLVVGNYNRISVVELEADTHYTQLLGLKLKGDEKEKSFVFLPNRYWGTSGSITKTGDTLQMALGLGGVAEVEMGEPVPVEEDRYMPIFPRSPVFNAEAF